MQTKGLGSKTIANVHGLISASFNTMVKEKRRTDNPCKGIALPKSSATEEKATFLTPDEWRLVQAELMEPYKSFFTFLIHTGLRYSEATALEAKHFETTSAGLEVVKVVRAWTRDRDNVTYIGPPKTSQSRRTVALTESAASDLRPLLRDAAARNSFVFVNTAGSHLPHNRAWDAWDSAVRKAQANGLTKRPRIHDLRHSNASWLLSARLGIFQLQKHLGHESITTTLDRYSHLMPEALRDTAAAMDRAFGTSKYRPASVRVSLRLSPRLILAQACLLTPGVEGCRSLTVLPSGKGPTHGPSRQARHRLEVWRSDYCLTEHDGLSRLIRQLRDCSGASVASAPPSRDERSVGPATVKSMTRELRNEDKGRYFVTTATGSQYELDLTARTVRRQIAATPPIIDFLEAGFSQLRRDGESVELLKLNSCAVGASARYWLQNRNDHTPTLRMTSPGMRIKPLLRPEA
jgi:integrase